MHLHLLQTHDLFTANQEMILAGKVTHGIGTVVKILIGFGILVGIGIALLVTSLVKKK